VSVNLNPSLPQRKLYQNLRGLGIVNAPEKLQAEMVVERLNNYLVTKPLLNEAGEYAVSRTNDVPEFSFATVSESEICALLCPSGRMPLVLRGYLCHSKNCFCL
jgi:hypothetical protein